MNKLEFLKSIEVKNSSLINPEQPTRVLSTPKKFITFPYAYMNGRLHLGHASTIQNADMQARFYKLCGYNVLFPFGYHGSGMPIVSSAKKLSREIDIVKEAGMELTSEYIEFLPTNNQLRILYEMNIPINEMNNFIDPYYWIIYFSERAKLDVKEMNPYIDFTRSFFTTSLNPYYDSFITWQFNHLIKKGLVYKGTRNMIYSELDNQPCADHDRAIGENVEPIKINTFRFEIFLVTESRKKPDNKSGVIVCGKMDYVKVNLNGEITIMSKKSYNNIKHQYSVEFLSDINYSEISRVFVSCDNVPEWGTGLFLVDGEQYERQSNNVTSIVYHDHQRQLFSYYEPESRVISRSGDTCVVASTEQWFIDYGNPELKAKVMNYVKTQFVSPTDSIKEMIEVAVEAMHERACSRNFGLGTKLPGTNDVIDSLSDSTIYMAYYTIAHLITQIPITEITHEVWDYIFLGIGEAVNEVVANARKEFEYWYPVDIRVSGKDLISSHLTYALFNHMAIWDDDKYMPKSYYVNGHLMMNGEKMSKSTGNFLTLSGAVEKYGSNAMRFALACNDGVQDGNFTDSNVTTAISKLFNELTFIQDNISTISNDACANASQFEFFEHQIKETLKSAHVAYTNAIYSDVIKGFYALISAKDEYLKKAHVEGNMIKLYSDAMYTLMTPICPTWTSEIELIVRNGGFGINVDWYINYSNPNIVKYQFYNDVMKYVKSEINGLITKAKKGKGNMNVKFVVEVIRNFTDEEQLVISNIKDLPTFFSQIPDKRKMGQYKGFATHINNHIEEYGELWLQWVNTSSLGEYEYIAHEAKFITNEFQVEVISVETKLEYQFKHNPGKPKIVQVQL
jgi:leucyl-tRNA synthetase